MTEQTFDCESIVTQAARELYRSGDTTTFLIAMDDIIQSEIPRAWSAELRERGLKPDDTTSKEKNELINHVVKTSSYVSRLMADVLKLRHDNQQFEIVLPKIKTWVGQWAVVSLEVKAMNTQTEDAYREKLERGTMYYLWSGQWGKGAFTSRMESVVNEGLTNAWAAGMKRGGLTYPDDQTDVEREEMFALIEQEISHIPDLADYIAENNKASGASSDVIINKAALWSVRWRDVESRAFLAAMADRPVTWHIGATEKHCPDCLWANGKTYRGSVWEKYNWHTQSQALSCHGYNCDCSLTDDGNKPNKGHPRMLIGGE